MTYESNPILDFANNYEFPEYSDQDGFHKVVAFGDESHKCPIYVKQVPPCTAGCPAGEDIRGYHNLLTGGLGLQGVGQELLLPLDQI